MEHITLYMDEHWLYVRFPDIPEILTGGSTLDDAIKECNNK